MSPPIAGLEPGVLEHRPRAPRDHWGREPSLVNWISLLALCSWQSALGHREQDIPALALLLGDFTHVDFPNSQLAHLRTEKNH